MSKEKLPRPYGNRILVLPDGVRETAGGIVLPDSDNDKVYYGTVVAVGPGSFDTNGNRMKCEVEINARVIFSRGFKAVDFDHGGKKYVSIFENDLVVGL